MHLNVAINASSSAQDYGAVGNGEVLGFAVSRDAGGEPGGDLLNGQAQKSASAGMVTNLRELPGEHPAAWMNRSSSPVGDDQITAESCYRPLSFMSFIIGDRGSLADRDNNIIGHEHIFFSDGTDVGFGSNGIMISENKSEYSMCEPLKATKKQVMDRVNQLSDQFEADDYHLLKHNCQDFVDIVGR